MAEDDFRKYIHMTLPPIALNANEFAGLFFVCSVLIEGFVTRNKFFHSDGICWPRAEVFKIIKISNSQMVHPEEDPF